MKCSTEAHSPVTFTQWASKCPSSCRRTHGSPGTKFFLQFSWLHLPGHPLSEFYGTGELCLFVTLTGKETGLVWFRFSSSIFFFAFMSGLFHVTYVCEIFHIAVCNIHLFLLLSDSHFKSIPQFNDPLYEYIWLCINQVLFVFRMEKNLPKFQNNIIPMQKKGKYIIDIFHLFLLSEKCWCSFRIFCQILMY